MSTEEVLAEEGLTDRRSREGAAGEETAHRSRTPTAGSPWLPRDYVPRAVFWNRLDGATSAAVTTVVAPAGAGKTMGVAGWLQHRRVGDQAIWLDAGSEVSLKSLAATLTTSWDDASHQARLIVIDDAHLLSGECVREIGQRLNQQPESMRVLLLARWDLAIGRLVPELLGHLTVIRGDALRLSDQETASLIRIHAPARADDLHQVVMERAHGWCAAVVLAARAGAVARDTSEFVNSFRSSSLEVAGLVAQEVFAGLQPRERHLLLCTATEGVVTVDTARELTHDPRAGEVLLSLERTGFLIHRVSEGDVLDSPGSGATRFRLHPLMMEVARRRLVAGGVDVQRARSTVSRAVRLQVAHGQVAPALRRLLVLGEFEMAADIVASRGPEAMVVDDGRVLDELVARGGAAIEDHPQVWAVVAWAMRRRGERARAIHWAERLLAHDATHPQSISPLQVATMRLLLARLGTHSAPAAVESARTAIARVGGSPQDEAFLHLLRLELGVMENWTGDLERAAEHLTDAVLGWRSAQLDALAHDTISHLALTEFMTGHDRAAHDLAVEVLSAHALDGIESSVVQRAETVRALVRLQAHPWPVPDEGPSGPGSVLDDGTVVDDPAGRFWQRLLAARTALLGGSIAAAQSLLRGSPEILRLPQHLSRALLAEQSRLSLVTLAHEHLREVSREFRRGGASGESLWVEAALADVQGEVRQSAEFYEAASRSIIVRQPSAREASMVCAAQLFHYLGDRERATNLLEEALDRSERRGDVTPFLGWSTHGTPVGVMLKDLPRHPTAWTLELTQWCTDHQGIAAAMRPRVATAQELSAVEEPVAAPSLSPREKEVLAELARGATYADIAQNLFVSSNTVKTHVSNLYVKLSATRRSEALATARKLHLL